MGADQGFAQVAGEDERKTLLVTMAPCWFLARGWLAILLTRDPQDIVPVAYDAGADEQMVEARKLSADVARVLYVPHPHHPGVSWQRHPWARRLVFAVGGGVHSVEVTAPEYVLRALKGYAGTEEAQREVRVSLGLETSEPPPGKASKKKGAPRAR